MEKQKFKPPCMAVNNKGNPLTDPTKNVVGMVEAAVKRINDLHLQELEFNEKLRQVDIIRANDLRDITTQRLNQALEDHKLFNKECHSNQTIFINKLTEERELRLLQKFESLDRAIEKAETANEKRFEGVNEFRNALRDQQLTLMTRHEYDSSHQSLQTSLNASVKTLTDIIVTQKERIDKLDNLKQGGINLWILIIGIVAIGMSVVTFVLGLIGK